MVNSKSNNPLIIFNPTAGDGQAIQRWEKFKKELSQHNIDYSVQQTKYRGHATEIASTAIDEGVTKLAIFSGDGTLNEALQGIMENDRVKYPDFKLIFLPAGSSCDFEKKFENPKSLIDRLLTDNSKPIDIFKVECRNFDGQTNSRYVINNSSIGVISLANEKFNAVTGLLKWIKQKSVDVGAVLCGAKALMEFTPITCNVSIDNKQFKDIKLSNISVFKTSHFGGDMHFGIKPIQDDGKLSVVVIDAVSKFRLFGLMPTFFTGTILKQNIARHYFCTSVRIESSDFAIVETDGENIRTPFAQYSILPKALQIIV